MDNRLYQNHEHLLITNQPNLQWVEATLQILNSHAGKYYVQDHTSEAQEKLNTIETFIYARNDEESFNMLIKRFINAKLTVCIPLMIWKEHGKYANAIFKSLSLN